MICAPFCFEKYKYLPHIIGARFHKITMPKSVRYLSMTSESMWELFMLTGNMVVYCLYRQLLDAETEDKTA